MGTDWMNGNKKYCMAIYKIESYVRVYNKLPPENYKEPLTDVAVGKLCKELALDYFSNDSKLYYAFSKKYKIKARDLFKNRKKEIYDLYTEAKTEEDAVVTEETKSETPANNAADKKEDDKMIIEKYFLAIANLKTIANKLSSTLSNKMICEQIHFPQSSLSKLLSGNYTGKRFNDSSLRFAEVSEETIDAAKEILGEDIVYRHYPITIVGEKLAKDEEFKNLSLKRMTMFDVIRHGKLFTDDNVNIITDIGLTCIIHSKCNKFIDDMLSIIENSCSTKYIVSNISKLKRLRKNTKYSKSKTMYCIEDIANITKVNTILNWLAEVDFENVTSEQSRILIAMYNCILYYNYNSIRGINRIREANDNIIAEEETVKELANKQSVAYDPGKLTIAKVTDFDKLDEIATIDTEDQAETNSIVNIEDILSSINTMTVEQLEMLVNYINEVKSSKIQISDASAKLMSLF